MVGMASGTDRPAWQDRVGALSGAAYVVLILVGNQLAEGSGSSTHQSGAQVLAHLGEQADSATAQIGMTMEILGFVGFAFFLPWLYTTSRNAGATWPAALALVGGTTTLAVKIGSGATAITLMTDRTLIDPQTAMVLNDLNGAAFVVTFITFGIFLVGAGLALLESRLTGRFAAWSAVVLGAAGVLLTLVTQADPISSNPAAVPARTGLDLRGQHPALAPRPARGRASGPGRCARLRLGRSAGPRNLCVGVPHGCIVRS